MTSEGKTRAAHRRLWQELAAGVCNYVQVSVSPIDCTLTFCDVVGHER